jgi:hypothetical protein
MGDVPSISTFIGDLLVVLKMSQKNNYVQENPVSKESRLIKQ